MCGLIEPTGGTIRIAGHDLATSSGRKAMRGSIVLLPQSPTCPRTFTVDDLLVYGAWLQQVPVGNVANADVDASSRCNWPGSARDGSTGSRAASSGARSSPRR